MLLNARPKSRPITAAEATICPARGEDAMNKMSIGRKLTMAFGVIISLTLILGIAAVFFLISLDNPFSQLYTEKVEPLPIITDITKETGQLRVERNRGVGQSTHFTAKVETTQAK